MADWPFEDTVEIGYVLGSECPEDPATARDFELQIELLVERLAAVLRERPG